MMRLNGSVNIRAIAEAAGISIASVSRALQDPPSPKVSVALRRKILRICDELHYEPNAHTQRMLSRCSRTISIMFPPRTALSSDGNRTQIDANLSGCVLGAQEALAVEGYGLLLNELSDSFVSSKSYVRLSRSKAVDGVLLWGALSDSAWIRELVSEDLPVVMLQTYSAEVPCTHVIADEFGGTSALVDRVLACGHRRIGLAPAPEAASTGRLRNEAVRRTLRDHGGVEAVEYVEQGYGQVFGRRAAQWIFEHSPEVTCIINSNDMAAWGCREEALSRGLRVPEDVSIVGGDGLAFPGEVKIASYYLPSLEIGRRGAELLLSLIRGESVPPESVLPVTSVPGNTLKRLV